MEQLDLNAESDKGYLCELNLVGGRSSAGRGRGVGVYGATISGEGFYVPRNATVGEVLAQFRSHGAPTWMTDSQLCNKVSDFALL
jgi:hypothetical protein